MKFYLDKELAKQNIARCLYKSDELLSDENLEKVRKYFNFQGEFLIYEGDDIPYPIEYDFENDTIKQAEIKEDIQPATLSNETQEVKDDFEGEEDGRTYNYLNREIAIKKGKTETFATFSRKLRDPENYFGGKALLFIGDTVPYYCTYIEETDTIREATEYEKYQRGQRKLSENEVVFKEEIVTLEYGQYLDEEKQEIIKISIPDGYLKYHWDKKSHTWIDETTDYDRVQAQYRDYEGMDTPSTVKEMELQDPTLSEEYINMMIELRTLMYSLQEKKELRMAAKNNEIEIPHASKALEAFKNRFNSK